MFRLSPYNGITSVIVAIAVRAKSCSSSFLFLGISVFAKRYAIAAPQYPVNSEPPIAFGSTMISALGRLVSEHK